LEDIQIGCERVHEIRRGVRTKVKAAEGYFMHGLATCRYCKARRASQPGRLGLHPALSCARYTRPQTVFTV
jgi:hypothetical protein